MLYSFLWKNIEDATVVVNHNSSQSGYVYVQKSSENIDSCFHQSYELLKHFLEIFLNPFLTTAFITRATLRSTNEALQAKHLLIHSIVYLSFIWSFNVGRKCFASVKAFTLLFRCKKSSNGDKFCWHGKVLKICDNSQHTTSQWKTKV